MSSGEEQRRLKQFNEFLDPRTAQQKPSKPGVYSPGVAQAADKDRQWQRQGVTERYREKGYFGIFQTHLWLEVIPIATYLWPAGYFCSQNQLLVTHELITYDHIVLVNYCSFMVTAEQ